MAEAARTFRIQLWKTQILLLSIDHANADTDSREGQAHPLNKEKELMVLSLEKSYLSMWFNLPSYSAFFVSQCCTLGEFFSTIFQLTNYLYDHIQSRFYCIFDFLYFNYLCVLYFNWPFFLIHFPILVIAVPSFDIISFIFIWLVYFTYFIFKNCPFEHSKRNYFKQKNLST
jgi:hypothetical protein